MRGFLVGLLAISSVAMSAEAQLVNGGFETGGLAPWYAATDSWFVTAADAHSGTYSAEVRANANVELRQDFAVPMPSNDVMLLSFWSRYPDPELFYGFLAATAYYTDGTESGKVWYPTSTDWTLYVGNDFVQPDKLVIGFGLFGAGSGKVTRIDDVQISAAPEPAGLVLLGTGLLALVGVRRRRHGHERLSSVIDPAPPVPFSS